MNSINLYVATTKMMLSAKPSSKKSYIDLFRLVPYLHQSLSCTVCRKLLIQPYSPKVECQHHVCKGCLGQPKNLIKPCTLCENYDTYFENQSHRLLLQCYKNLCQYFMGTQMYKSLLKGNRTVNVRGGTVSKNQLLGFVQSGAMFSDNFGLKDCTPSDNDVVPFLFDGMPAKEDMIPGPLVATSPKAVVAVPEPRVEEPQYSVTYAETGNKITIKRTSVPDITNTLENEDVPPIKLAKLSEPETTKRIRRKRDRRVRGCRCGTASTVPGKLTCCGQRCPCYAQSKACIECKCKGCRNTHKADGTKVKLSEYEPFNDLETKRRLCTEADLIVDDSLITKEIKAYKRDITDIRTNLKEEGNKNMEIDENIEEDENEDVDDNTEIDENREGDENDYVDENIEIDENREGDENKYVDENIEINVNREGDENEYVDENIEIDENREGDENEDVEENREEDEDENIDENILIAVTESEDEEEEGDDNEYVEENRIVLLEDNGEEEEEETVKIFNEKSEGNFKILNNGNINGIREGNIEEYEVEESEKAIVNGVIEKYAENNEQKENGRRKYIKEIKANGETEGDEEEGKGGNEDETGKEKENKIYANEEDFIILYSPESQDNFQSTKFEPFHIESSQFGSSNLESTRLVNGNITDKLKEFYKVTNNN